MIEQLTCRVPRWSLTPTTKQHRTRRRRTCDPTERDVEKNTGPRIRGDTPSNFSHDQSIALKTRVTATREEFREDKLRQARTHITQHPMRSRVRGFRVRHLRSLSKCGIEQILDVRGIVLSIFVQRDDPVATGRCHARQSCGVLSEISAKPDRSNETVGIGELTNHLV